MELIAELRNRYKKGSTTFRLIFINTAVFLLVSILALIFFLFNIGDSEKFTITNWVSLPADMKLLLYRPWTLITYMFLHRDFMHILFNMLWLFWFGNIFLSYFTSRQMTSLYILGGLTGAAFYIGAYNLFPVFEPVVSASFLLGASASVYAIVIAISAYIPDYSIGLLFLGRIKLKYIALIVIIIDLASIPQGNAGGHISHLGGALFGFLFAVSIKRGKDITKIFSDIMDAIFTLLKPSPKMKVHANKYKQKQNPSASGKDTKSQSDQEYNRMKAQKQAVIDKILDKISKSGYESLTKEEKETLFNAGK
ncbi:MAG: rhomboid family intramembrane serine protease [Bacteroidales bacterium]